jgi:hypothetical protein
LPSKESCTLIVNDSSFIPETIAIYDNLNKDVYVKKGLQALKSTDFGDKSHKGIRAF